MVAKVISGKTIRGALSYNERKVKAGVAKCIMANQFGCEPKELSFHTKLNRFEKLNTRNQKTKTNTLHISLNFDVAENLSEEKLCQIASLYMDKIGFGNQPYLIYQHHDAAHPHIHILTTNIQENARRIDIHNIGRNQSEKARKEIEILFGLVKAESKKKNEGLIKPIDIKRAIYGKSETKRSISNAVQLISQQYKYTSLPEFNAALRQFNVVADRGSDGSKMYNKRGLQYSLLDGKGNKVGIPVKASSIYGKPTLAYLEKQFKLNEALRQPYKDRVRSCIDKCFKANESITQSSFGTALQREGIYVLLRQANDGRVYGITFVDNKTKVVFNGSDLGKPYGAKAILDRIADTPYAGGASSSSSKSESEPGEKTIELNLGVSDVINDLVTAKQFDFTSPDSAMKRRKKKKKKGRSL
jgi:hypothetical protein